MNQDERLGQKLNLHPDNVRACRRDWNGQVVMKAVMADDVAKQVTERESKLRTCKPEDLLKLQGEIAGLELAIAMLIRTQP